MEGLYFCMRIPVTGMISRAHDAVSLDNNRPDKGIGAYLSLPLFRKIKGHPHIALFILNHHVHHLLL